MVTNHIRAQIIWLHTLLTFIVACSTACAASSIGTAASWPGLALNSLVESIKVCPTLAAPSQKRSNSVCKACTGKKQDSRLHLRATTACPSYVGMTVKCSEDRSSIRCFVIAIVCYQPSCETGESQDRAVEVSVVSVSFNVAWALLDIFWS